MQQNIPDIPALKVACIGEAMVELTLDRDRAGSARIGFAGDTLNTAIYLKRCAPDMAVFYVTRLGQDQFSAQMLDFMQGEGLDTSLVGASVDRAPGLYAIATDAVGERSFAYWRDRSAARELFAGGGPQLSALAGFDVIYLSAITLAILTPGARADLMGWLQGFRRGGGKVAFDSNYRPALWPDAQTARRAIEAMWRLTDIALPGLDDEQAIFGDTDRAAVRRRFVSYGVQAGALKCGAEGPVPFGLGTAADMKFAKAGHVVDSTAAGDSFNGAYLGAHLGGASPLDCLRAGHDLALRVLGVQGAILPKGS